MPSGTLDVNPQDLQFAQQLDYPVPLKNRRDEQNTIEQFRGGTVIQPRFQESLGRGVKCQ